MELVLGDNFKPLFIHHEGKHTIDSTSCDLWMRFPFGNYSFLINLDHLARQRGHVTQRAGLVPLSRPREAANRSWGKTRQVAAALLTLPRAYRAPDHDDESGEWTDEQAGSRQPPCNVYHPKDWTSPLKQGFRKSLPRSTQSALYRLSPDPSLMARVHCAIRSQRWWEGIALQLSALSGVNLRRQCDQGGCVWIQNSSGGSRSTPGQADEKHAECRRWLLQ